MTPQELQDNIKQAMKNHDNLARDTYRLVTNELKNIEVNERREVNEQDVTNMLKRVLKQTSETRDYAIQASNKELVEELNNKIDILQNSIPKQLDGFELRLEIDRTIDANHFNSKKDIGSIMKHLNDITNGNFNRAYAGQYLSKAFG